MAFKVCMVGNCSVSVTDLNDENYQNSSILTTSGSIYYTFLESATVNALISITYDDTRTVQDFDITTHNSVTNDLSGETTYITDESTLTFGTDGLYEVQHLILPTEEFILAHESENLSKYFPNGIYFVKEGNIYKYLGENEYELVEANLIFEINVEDTTIIKEAKNTFSVCHLQDCYYNLCKKLLNNLCSCNRNCNVLNTYADDIFNRDLINMALHAIQYALDTGQYYEAQRLLEIVTGCGEICAEFDPNKSNKNGCGCNH